MSSETERPSAPAFRGALVAVLVLAYVVCVHSIDILATFRVRSPIDWSLFSWRWANGFDGFKFVAWLVLPAILTIRKVDLGYFGVTRWKRLDVVLFLAFMLIGVAAVFAVPHLPGVRELYIKTGNLPIEMRREIALSQFVWTMSWLVGWEFLHRCTLLVFLKERWPRAGWLLIPLIEGAYHLQKPLIEAVGMTLYSLTATYWSLRRNNMLLPLLVHFTIEVALIAYMYL